jgi:hypothetical protein
MSDYKSQGKSADKLIMDLASPDEHTKRVIRSPCFQLSQFSRVVRPLRPGILMVRPTAEDIKRAEEMEKLGGEERVTIPRVEEFSDMA